MVPETPDSAVGLGTRQHRRLVALFVILLSAVAATIALSSRSLRHVLRNEERVSHTYRVMAELDATLAALTDAETGQRGFLFTGRESYLEPYNAATVSVGEHIRNLKAVTSDNPSQQQMVALIERRASEKLVELSRTLDAWRRGDAAAARAIVLSDEGKAVMDELRGLVTTMKNVEEALLQQRRTESLHSARQASLVMLAAGGALAALLLLFYGQVRRSEALRTKLLESEQRGRHEAERAYVAEHRAHDELQRANHVKDQFLATVSHELRTPLNAMLGWASMLRRGTGGEMLQRGLASIERNARAQAQLVEDLLDVSRVIAGKMTLDTRSVEVQSVVRQALDVVGPAADAKGITIAVEGDPAECWVSADPDRLQQVVWNLLSNAVKFTPRDGRVVVRCVSEGSYIGITVADTGQGIPGDFLPHIFEPFRQVDASSTRAQGGLGLGLALVRSLVELHGGTVSVTSAGPEKGASFTVRLPILDIRKVDARQPDLVREGGGPSLRHLKVLVVDDQPDSLDVVSVALMTCGADVRTCSRADEALEETRRWRPDVLIADIAMPGEDGYSLIRKVRALPERDGGHTPAIALTAHARGDDRLLALDAGFDMHVPKPVEPQELASIVASLSGREIA
jgi:signal transduction histidine kinase